MGLRSGILMAISLAVAVESTLQAQHSRNGVGQPAPHVNARPTGRPAGPNLGGSPYPIRTDLPAPLGLTAPAAAYTGISPGALRPLNNHAGGVKGGRGNFGVGYGGFYGLPYLPYSDTSSYYTYPSFSEQAEAISARNNAQVQDAMAQQMSQMNDELHFLRDMQLQGMNAPQQQPLPAPAAPAVSEPEQQETRVPITLVLQNGAKLSVNNYAVMNNIIWDFSKQPARKIPVSTINVGASEKLTEQNGGEFPDLTSNH